MKKADFRKKKYLILRKKYPRFVYNNYSWRISKNNLEIAFEFLIEPDIFFRPKITIENINKSQIKRVGDRVLKNLVFHLGLIEMLTYWKATCSPELIIKTGYLNPEQIKWWKDIITKGMGQFFYENKIYFTKPSFIKIKSKNHRLNIAMARLKRSFNSNKVLVPIGGGKDSMVTLEILKRVKKEISSFSLNPTAVTKKIIKIAGCKNPIVVRRKIDKKLIKLNRKGFLNGHTPFSAYLAFLSVLAASIFNQKYIAFSNERSSNEGNLRYLGKVINHQWSKSFEFERKFRNYSKKYLVKNVEYFSFLRPLYEIQTAKLFSTYPRYFPVFLSCNEAYKTDSGRKSPSKKWCSNCPKCLFIFTVLYPFVGNEKLIKIFGKNLFENPSGKKLLPIMQELIGKRRFKPFECVGTKKESLVAFYLALPSFMQGRVKRKLPNLLKHFREIILPEYPNLKAESRKLMASWNEQNCLPPYFDKILRKIILNTVPQFHKSIEAKGGKRAASDMLH